MAEPVYEERYCAFVDILGFRELINQLRDGKTDYLKLKRILNEIHDPIDAKREGFADTDFKALSISDAVALSTKTTVGGLGQLIYVLRELTLSLLYEGFFIRGAIVKRKLYHDSTTVFGEGLVEAYRLESEVARYPRIMVVRNVVHDASICWGKGYRERIRQSEDGPSYVHVLRPIERDIASELERNPEIDADQSEQLNYYVQIADRIQEKFREAVDDPKHFKKVQWFARYWNDRIKNLPIESDSP